MEYKSFVAQEILKSGLIKSRFQILYPGAICVYPGQPTAWGGIFGPDDAVIHSFEADKDDHGRGVVSDHHAYRYHDDVLWSEEGEVTLFVNKTIGGSSLFPHNFKSVDRWGYIGAGPDIKEVRLQATTVTQWAVREGVDDLDFAHLNVEGAELAILNGMGSLLDRVVAVVVETNFAPNYLIGAPVFADVDLFLRERGFTFFSFIDNTTVYLTRRAAPITDVQRSACFPSALQGRQVLQSHSLYLRDPIGETTAPGRQDWTLDRCLKLAFWADINDQADFAFEVLAWVRDRHQEPEVKLAVQRLIDAAAARFAEATEEATGLAEAKQREASKIFGEAVRFQAAERRLKAELDSKLGVIEAQRAQIERMHAAYTELLRANLELSGIKTGGDT